MIRVCRHQDLYAELNCRYLWCELCFSLARKQHRDDKACRFWVTRKIHADNHDTMVQLVFDALRPKAKIHRNDNRRQVSVR